jgi:hypothetical protein
MFGLEIEVKAYESCLSLRISTVSRAHHGDIEYRRGEIGNNACWRAFIAKLYQERLTVSEIATEISKGITIVDMVDVASTCAR